MTTFIHETINRAIFIQSYLIRMEELEKHCRKNFKQRDLDTQNTGLSVHYVSGFLSPALKSTLVSENW